MTEAAWISAYVTDVTDVTNMANAANATNATNATNGNPFREKSLQGGIPSGTGMTDIQERSSLAQRHSARGGQNQL
jgi:hypothetical protein